MTRRRARFYRYTRGLQTTREATGQPTPHFPTFTNVRVDRGGAYRRHGMVNIGRVTPQSYTAARSDGAGHAAAAIPNGQIDLGVNWTSEMLVELEHIGSVGPIIGWSGTTWNPLHVEMTAADKIEVRHKDASSVTVTLTSASTFAIGVYAIQVVRQGTSLVLKVNDVEEASGTVSEESTVEGRGSILFFKDSPLTDYFHGIIDFVRFQTVAKSTHRMGWTRHPNPRGPSMRGQWIFHGDTLDQMHDESPWESHALDVGGLDFAPDTLSNNPDPIQGIGENKGGDNIRRLIVSAGGQTFAGDLR